MLPRKKYALIAEPSVVLGNLIQFNFEPRRFHLSSCPSWGGGLLQIGHQSIRFSHQGFEAAGNSWNCLVRANSKRFKASCDSIGPAGGERGTVRKRTPQVVIEHHRNHF